MIRLTANTGQKKMAKPSIVILSIGLTVDIVQWDDFGARKFLVVFEEIPGGYPG